MKHVKLVIMILFIQYAGFRIFVDGWSGFTNILFVMVWPLVWRSYAQDYVIRPTLHDVLDEDKQPEWKRKIRHYATGHEGWYEQCENCQTLETV